MNSGDMDAVWSLEFLAALIAFMIPMAVAGWMVYRRMRTAIRRPKGAPERAAEQTAAPRAAVSAQAKAVAAEAPKDYLESLQEPLENVRRHLVELGTSLRRSHSELGQFQEGLCRLSMVLSRTNEVFAQSKVHEPIARA